MSTDVLLEASSLHKSFRQIHALRNVDVTVHAGEIVCLLGPNGAGKTTLTAIVAGIMSPDRGEVRISGIDVRRAPQRAHRHLGLAPQETGVYPMLDVSANLRLFCELAGIRKRAASTRIEEIVDSLLLTKLTGRRVQELSGGEKRRLHLAIALVHEPELLILDEPSVGSDVVTRRRLLTVVRDRAAAGCGVLYTTHYLGEVEELGGSVMILNAGSVVSRGGAQEIQPSDQEVVVELVFSGSPPTLELSALDPTCLAITNLDDRVRITTREPGRAVASVLPAIASHLDRLQAVNTLRPTLEDLVASLSTGDDGEDAGVNRGER